jgi:hypothetical protein
MESRKTRLALVAMVTCIAALSPLSAWATRDVYSPHDRVAGKSYGEWTGEWWQWAFSMPTSSHPLFDTADCDAGQHGKVWFLGGAFTGAPTTRSCTVPAGKALLMPALNAECSNVEPPPFFGSNEAELRACAQSFMALARDAFATLDGEPLPLSHVYSPLYRFTAVPGGILGNTEALCGISVSDGLWLFLRPLSGGQHTLRFGGRFDFPDGSSFPIDVTYNLTVRGHRGRDRTAEAPGESVNESWGVIKQLYR